MHDGTIFNHCGCMYYYNANERNIVNYVKLMVELHKPRICNIMFLVDTHSHSIIQVSIIVIDQAHLKLL